MAINLLQRHFYFWLAQLMLISISRCQLATHLPKMREFVHEAFAGNTWELSLAHLIAGGADASGLLGAATTTKKRCQLAYYEGAKLLTAGDRAAATASFQACVQLPPECMEHTFAQSELAAPEPSEILSSRLLANIGTAAQSEDGPALLAAGRRLLAESSAARFLVDSPLARSLELLSDLLGQFVGDAFVDLRERTFALLAQQGHKVDTRHSSFLKDIGASLPYIARVPLSRFDGFTRQVKAAELDPLQAAAILFGFPIFLGRPKAFAYAEHPVIHELRDSGQGGHEGSPFARRRFSGDGSEPLSRARYHSVCVEGQHGDNGTLVSELNAYSAPSITGYVVARDSADPGAIEIVFRGLPGDPNPLYLAATDTPRFSAFLSQFPAEAAELKAHLEVCKSDRLIPDNNQIVVSIPCQISRLIVDRCLDLRLPESRAWMLDYFRRPPSGLFGEVLQLLAQLHEFPSAPIETWEDLLPATNAALYGGNPLTDMFGTFLRNVGAHALVYPSARNDYATVVRNGRLDHHFGWNLVDYRGSVVNAKVGIDAGNPIRPRPGRYRVVDITTGEESGSLMVSGNLLHTLSDLEQGLHEYIVSNGSEWRIRNAQRVMRFKGYLWFSRDYSIDRIELNVRCSNCDASFSEEAVFASLHKCPSCDHRGDVLRDA